MPEKKPSKPKPAQKRKVYSTVEIEHALALARTILHPDGGINWTRASRQLEIAVNTLKKWDADPPGFGVNDDSVTTIKNEIQESYLGKAKRVREALLDRLAELAPIEKDMFKVAGAFKTVSEAASSEEVDRAIATRIAATQPAPTRPPENGGMAGSPDPALN